MNNSIKGKTLFDILIELIQNNTPCVFTTVTNSIGSTPQKSGSSAIWTNAGLISGTIGGGSVENTVSKMIPTALESNESGIYTFNLNNEIEDKRGSICGGGMHILLDSSPEKSRNIFSKINKSLKKYEQGILLTQFTLTNPSDIERFWLTKENILDLENYFPSEVSIAVNEILNNYQTIKTKSITSRGFKGEIQRGYFLELIKPLPRLIIAGAGHVGKALSLLGKLLDFEVIVWDDRIEYANSDNLPDSDFIISGDIENLVNFIECDNNTFIVIVTRGHLQDAEVLKSFIGSNAYYIGMMGSKRKILQIHEKFVAEGWATEEQWKKVFTPIGLDINSVTVQEIAVSIAAQLVLERRKNDG